MDDTDPCPVPSPFVSVGGELHLSNRDQLQLLQAVTVRGARFRTTARGYSMSPFIRHQDVLTIAPLNGVVLRVGEVVAFILPGCDRLAIHRVIALADDGWMIRGDNVSQADGVVSCERILGRVTRVERRGRTVHFGLGKEARLIAWLQRADMLMPAVSFMRRVRQQFSRVKPRLSGN